jgi:hypothetical protein
MNNKPPKVFIELSEERVDLVSFIESVLNFYEEKEETKRD